MKKTLLVVIAVILVSTVSMAQLSAGKIGVSTDIPGGSIGGAYALSENMRVDAGVTFSSFAPPVGSSATTIGVGASVKMYSPAVENVTYFYGAGFGFGTSGSPSVSTINIHALGGAEYWFSPRFAMGGYASFGFVNTGASGAKSTTIGTQGVSTTMTWWIN
jgi:hypothetical protein